jgi:hypothetical protein
MEDEPVEDGDSLVNDGQVNDPFSPDNAPGMSLIVQMRMYDVLLAILNEQNPDVCDRILEAHAQGKLLAPVVTFNGEFEYNRLNP